MVGAVQIGAFAACVVLFVPMGMAGWHLSRNKVLFFSGALFITLAVGVHLMPYFPSVSNIYSSFSPSLSESTRRDRDSCLSFLHNIYWEQKNASSSVRFGDFNSSNFNNSWAWARSIPTITCGFQKFSQIDALELLNGSWVVVAGDSQARFFVLSLLGLMLESTVEIEGDLFKRHSDYQLVLKEHGLKLDFVWAPFVANLTELMKKLKKDHVHPDVLVMGSGLWHMLHFTDASDYGISLGSLRRSVISLLPFSPDFGTDGPVEGSVSVQSPHMFWLGMPALINSMLNSEVKRERMTEAMCGAYAEELYRSRLLHRSGGPLLLLDIRLLSRNCGSVCTIDGMHYTRAVYEAAVHTMLNALLIESRQQI